MGTDRSTAIELGSMPSGNSSPPTAVMKRASVCAPPRCSNTVESLTPVHSAHPAAPTPQGEPDGEWAKNARPLPEHWSTLAIVVVGRALSSARLSGYVVSCPSSPLDGNCPEIPISDNLRLRHWQIIAHEKLRNSGDGPLSVGTAKRL